MRDVHLLLAGQGCLDSDALIIERRLSKIAGVAGATVNPISETAYVTCDPGVAEIAMLAAVIEEMGFQVVEVTQQ